MNARPFTLVLPLFLTLSLFAFLASSISGFYNFCSVEFPVIPVVLNLTWG